jgi:hypothetical protein
MTGSMIIAQLNYSLAGEALCKAWLNCLALSDKVYSDPGHGVAVHLATSLPRAILLSQPVANHVFIKPWLYLLAFILLLLGLGATLKLSSSRLEEQDKLKYSFVLGALALPVVVPHLFIYDLGALVPAALMLFFDCEKVDGNNHPMGAKASLLQRWLKGIVIVLWLTVTIYCLALVVNKALAPPLLLVAVLLGSYLAAVTVALRSK